MNIHRSAARLLGGLLAGAGALAAQGLHAYADIDTATHQMLVNSNRLQGYRPRTLTVHGSEAAPRYTSTWVQGQGPQWDVFHALDEASYTAYHTAKILAGWRPLQVSVTGPSGVYAGVYVNDGKRFMHVWDIDKDVLYEKFKEAMADGLLLTQLAVYGASSAPRFSAVWEETDLEGGYNYAYGDSTAAVQERFNALTAVGVRPSFVGMAPAGSYQTIWRDDQVSGGWAMRHDMDRTTLLAEVQNRFNQGFAPASIAAWSTGGLARYAAVFVGSDTIVAKQWRTPTGTSVAGFAAFDDYVRTLMQDNEIRAAGLAIARNGRLVYSRGYTYAEPGYPTTQPTTAFRVASCSKPITATAVHREMARNNGLALNTTLNSQLPVSSLLLRDPRQLQVEVRHLLSHTAGWKVSALGFDPTFHDVPIANWNNVLLPITLQHIYGYMSYAQGLQFAPDADAQYSNYGSALLGKILEARNPGMTYGQIVQRDLFAPLGITRARMLQPILGQQPADEARYHGRGPAAARSVLSPARPMVPAEYGSFNPFPLHAAGSWVMAAPDYAKFLAAFDLGAANPILPQAWTDVMWSHYDQARFPELLRGWFEVPLRNENGTLVNGVQHNGGMSGTAALAVRRNDGLSFVLFVNRNLKDGLHAGNHGVALNAIANQIASWPSHDLFPSVGLPAFQFPCPSISGTSAAGVANVGRTVLRITGQNLSFVTRVVIGDRLVTNRDANDVSGGWFRVDSDNQISFIPPQAMPTGSVQLRVGHAHCTSNGASVALTQPLWPALVGPQTARVGRTMQLYAARGATNSPQSVLQLVFSASNVPSALPGVVSLGLGNNFQSMLLWPQVVATSPTTGAAAWVIPAPVQLRGYRLFAEAVVADLGSANQLPLDTTNTVAIEFE